MSEIAINLPVPTDGRRVTSEFVEPLAPLPEAPATAPLLAMVNAFIEAQGGGQGLFPTGIESVSIVRSFQQMMPMRRIYRPSLCLVLTGAKLILFGDAMLDYRAMEYLVVSIELPGTGRIIEAGPDRPFVGVTIDLDVAMLRDVLAQLDPLPRPASGSGPCVFVGQVDEALADCVQRLIRISQTPGAIPVLYPSVMREICYLLLSGPHGGELCNLTLPESSSERIARAIRILREDFAKTVRIETLAEAARMSQSSFHQHFKSLTAMTPLQFQKQLRLLEARRLMVADAASVAQAAYQVGYESPSQFSREYSRTFGVAPKRDAMNQARLYATYASRKMPAA